LEAEKAKRRVKAEAHQKEVLKEYKKKKAAALKAGTQVPSFPGISYLLTNEIDLRDGGWATTENNMRHYVLVDVGFSQKDAPHLSLRSLYGDERLDPCVFVICNYCKQHNLSLPSYKWVVYPRWNDPLLKEHCRRCKHNPYRLESDDVSAEEEDDEDIEEDDESSDEEEEEEEG
jgi:hypothetical protein